MWQASARHAEAHDFGVNPRAARLRRFQRLQHEHGGAFAQDHAAAILGKRAAGIRRDHPHRLPCLQNAEAEGRFAAAGERQIGHAGAHHPVGLADGMAGRGAGGRDGEARSGDAEFHGDVAGARIRHGLRNGQRMDAVVAQLVDFVEAEILGALAAHAGARDDGGRFAQFRRPLDPGICDRLARGDDGELREAVDEIGAPVVEVGLVACSRAPRRRSEIATGTCRWIRSGAMPRRPCAQRVREFGGIPAQRADRAHAGDGDSAHRLLAGLRRPAALAATSLSTPSHICRTLRTLRTSSSGMLMSNSFSSANRISTASMESMPNCSKSLSIVTVSRGMRLDVAITFRHALDQFVGHISRLTVSNL